MEELVKQGHRYVLFDLAIVPDHLFTDSPVCPHCDSPEHPFLSGYVEEKHMIGDIMECGECEQHFIVFEKPKFLNLKEPIFTKWTVEDGLAK